MSSTTIQIIKSELIHQLTQTCADEEQAIFDYDGVTLLRMQGQRAAYHQMLDFLATLPAESTENTESTDTHSAPDALEGEDKKDTEHHDADQ